MMLILLTTIFRIWTAKIAVFYFNPNESYIFYLIYCAKASKDVFWSGNALSET